MPEVPPLNRRQLGASELEVSVVGLGGNTFGPPRVDLAQTRAVIHAALDMGVNFVDTANVYGQGLSEEYIGESLGTRREEMVIATKFNFRVPGEGDISRRIHDQAEASLRRLRTDHIDLYQLHMPDPGVPPGEILSALDEPIGAGKVRAIGVCNYSAWRLAESAIFAGTEGLATFSTVQNYYHLLARDVESEVTPFARTYGVSVLPYHPLGGGFLTGKYEQHKPAPDGSRGGGRRRNHRRHANRGQLPDSGQARVVQQSEGPHGR